MWEAETFCFKKVLIIENENWNKKLLQNFFVTFLTFYFIFNRFILISPLQYDFQYNYIDLIYAN